MKVSFTPKRPPAIYLLIAGVFIASMINADVGKIVPGLPIQDAQFLDQLRKLTSSRVPVTELPFSAVAGDPKSAVPAPER
jgi:hypothetical protein